MKKKKKCHIILNRFLAFRLVLVVSCSASDELLSSLLSSSHDFDDQQLQQQQQQQGLTYHIYDNAALAGSPKLTGITRFANLSLAAVASGGGDDYLSGELMGTIQFQRIGKWKIECDFQHTSTGFVWIDGHLMCGDNRAYDHPHETEGPLMVVDITKVYPFRARITNNDTTTTISSNQQQQTTSVNVNFYHREKNKTAATIKTYTEARVGKLEEEQVRSLRQPQQEEDQEAALAEEEIDDRYQEEWKLASPAKIDDDVVFTPDLPPPEAKRDELQRRLVQDGGWGSWLRVDLLSIVKLPEGLVVKPTLCYKNESDCLTIAIPDDNTAKVDLHAYDKSYVGYNVTHPRGATISIEYAVSSSSPSSEGGGGGGGPHQQRPMGKNTSNINKNDQLQALITLLECPTPSTNCKDFEIIFQAHYAWFRPGTITTTANNSISSSSPTSLSYHTPGLGTTNVLIHWDDDDSDDSYGSEQQSTNYSTTKSNDCPINNSNNNRNPVVRIPLGKIGTKVGITSGVSRPPPNGPSSSSCNRFLRDIEATLKANKAAEIKRIQTKFGPNKASVALAIQCAVMWTLIYNPVENGPFMPVSRAEGWGCQSNSCAVTPDWTYTIFDWDNLFASLLAGLDNKEIAYSNLFQVAKSKTTEGFVPNWSSGGAKSQDRTEPPVGAKVVLELFRKYNETWPVEVVFDDLLDWNNWFVANRVLQPAGLIALGSHYDPESWSQQRHHDNIVGDEWNTMQAARWESGLDNSPMYDGNFYDKDKTHLMQLYDVGMSSLFTQEAYSLAELADIIGRDPEVGQMLRKRADDMASNIARQLWDPTQGIFTNRFPNGTSAPHVSPTSFYPLAVGVGSQDQIDQMMGSWLLNSTRFCISSKGDFDGNNPDACYWGLPSISADDPTYMKGNWIYWRGYTWGPMAQLVYWGLEKYDGLAGNARKALCKQMESLMMSQWEANRHICENYHPYKNASDCSGTNFYHWGALHGLIGMMEDGYWSNDDG